MFEPDQELNPENLMAEAKIASGLSDYGDEHFVKPLTTLLQRAVKEVDFNDQGLASFKSDILRLLVNRLRVQADITKHPDILDEDVSDPIIIIGPGRSGTTKMHRMLSAGPSVQKLTMWRMLNPAPFPDAIDGQLDPRLAAAGVDSLLSSGKEWESAHAMAAGDVEEETILFDFTCDPSINGYSSYIPVFMYDEWIENKERAADLNGYRYVRTLLQYLQWQDGGKRNRPWVLKTTFHNAHMDALLECYPNATLVHCHRDPRDALPSLAKLIWSVWSAKANISKKFTGEGFLEYAKIATTRYLEARERLQLDDRILDVSFDDIRNNISPIIETIFHRAGVTLTDQDRQAMMTWEQNNEQGKHGKHSYSPEEFGLSYEAIKQAYAQYIPQFIDAK